MDEVEADSVEKSLTALAREDQRHASFTIVSQLNQLSHLFIQGINNFSQSILLDCTFENNVIDYVECASDEGFSVGLDLIACETEQEHKVIQMCLFIQSHNVIHRLNKIKDNLFFCEQLMWCAE